jgi:glucose-6-phosphate isomerase
MGLAAGFQLSLALNALGCLIWRYRMLYPEGVTIDGRTGAVTPSTGCYVKRLSELSGIFRDRAAFARTVTERNDPVVYEVIDYRKSESDICFGTTIMSPGTVGDEYYMTRGHFHERRDCGEAYFTQSGEGLLLLESRSGQTRSVEMRPGVCAFIPPDWAHRSVNTGTGKLVFAWFCATDAGHDYGTILTRGMRKLVVQRTGGPALLDNPNFN